ncbi:MAG: hypothetical protein K2J29_08395, partial [Muribaculaceae bacterium]|nr:hypothetical protein [Muribaculaceae bacterium]
MNNIPTYGNDLKCVFLGRKGYREVLQRQHDIFDNLVTLKRNHESTGEEIILMVSEDELMTLVKQGKD